MEAAVDARFERVEKALAALIDSIAKYNPSLQVGTELIAAEEELRDGLLLVQSHQENHVRIRALRDASAALDQQIRSTLSTLSSTRRDMAGARGTVFPDTRPNEISYDELLSYARRISKTTLPPAGVTNGVVAAAAAAAAATAADDLTQPGSATASAAATPNGTAPTTPAVANTPQPAPAVGAASSSSSSQGGGAAAVLPQDWSNWLNPHTGAVFIPWPQDNQIRAGALSSNEILAESGVDIRGYDPVEEERKAAAAAAEAKRLEEERLEAERAARAEREAMARAEMERRREAREREQREALRRGSTALDVGAATAAAAAAAAGPGSSPTSASPAVKKQFQFMGDDDDDDDSD